MMHDYEASIGEAYERGVEVGRGDAVPPGVEPMPWCEPHDEVWTYDVEEIDGCFTGFHFGWLASCHREDPVAHWVTVKEETT